MIGHGASGMTRALLAAAIGAGAAMAPLDGRAAVEVAAAAPRVAPFSLSLDFNNFWRREAGYKMFHPDRRAVAPGLTLDYNVLRGRQGMLALGAGFYSESLDRPDAMGGPSSLKVATLFAQVTARYPLTAFLQPQLRVAGGVASADVTVQPGGPLEGSTRAPMGMVGLGLRAQTGQRPPTSLFGRLGLALAVTVEGGYAFGGALDLAVSRRRPGDSEIAKDRITAVPVSLGSLPRSHPYTRVSAAVLF